MRPGPLPLGARVRSDSGGCFPWQPSLSIKSRDRGLSYRGWGKKVMALSFSSPQPRRMTAFEGVDSVPENTGAPWVTRTPGLQIRRSFTDSEANPSKDGGLAITSRFCLRIGLFLVVLIAAHFSHFSPFLASRSHMVHT